ASVTAPSISFGAVKRIAASADLSVTPSALTITRSDVTWDGGHARVNGTAGLTGDRPLDLVLDADVPDLRALGQAAIGADVSVTGSLRAHGTVAGTVARPSGSLALEGADVVAFGEALGSLSAAVTVAGRDVTLSRLVIDKPQPGTPGRISATGSYNLTRSTYTLAFQSQDVRLLALTLPGGRRIRGNVQLSGKGAGSVGSP